MPTALGGRGWALPCGQWGSSKGLNRDKEARLGDSGQFSNSCCALDSLLSEMKDVLA